MESNDYKNIKTILRLFPYLKDKTKRKNLKIDNESIYYISFREHAQQITNIIEDYLVKLGIDSKDAVITDATAGVGGNTISFGMNFKYVNSIEIDKMRYDYLKNNIDVYGLNNINTINNDCIKVLHELDNHDVIFIDPPWGGKSYKDYNNLKLQLSNIPIEMICKHLCDSNIMKKVPEIIILKLPINYDIFYLYNYLKNKTIYFHDLKKMYIIVIINKKLE
jgi:16S rRNA G966 N2-methylase RsmD